MTDALDIGPYPATQIGLIYRSGTDRPFVEKYGNCGSPFFRIEISDQNENILFSAESNATGGNYDLNGLIVSDVNWEENDCQSDMLTMTVNNIDMQLHNSKMFAEGNTVDLWMGYDNRLPDYMGRGIIVEIAHIFEADSMPKIDITAYDISHFMMEEGRAEIQAEDTVWWERRSVTASDTGNTEESTQIALDREHVEGEAPNPPRADERSGPSPVRPPVGPSANLGDTEIMPYEAASEGPEREVADPSSGQTSIGRARMPGRRRNNGKVWRQLTDSEIADAIFRSYRIVPYTEATDERTRTRRVTTATTPSTQRQSTVELDNILDTDSQRLQAATQAQQTGRTNPHPTNVSIDQLSANARTHGIDPAYDPSTRAIHATVRNSEVTNTRQTVEVVGRRVTQKSGTSDWEFLKKLAKNHGYIVFVFFHYDSKRWIGYWGSPHHVPQYIRYTFDYNSGDQSTLKTFKPRVSMRGQKSEIDLVYVDPVLRREQRLSVSIDSLNPYTPEFRGPDATTNIEEPIGNGPEVTLMIHGQRVSVTANRRFASLDDARRWLMAYWYRHASEFCEAEGASVIGLPEIHCRHTHSIRGFGRYDGLYFFTQVSHRMAAGNTYDTSFSMYRLGDTERYTKPDQETNALSVQSNQLGQINAAAQDVIARWREAGILLPE